MAAKNLAHPAFSSIAEDGIADGFSGSDDADSASVISRVVSREPPKREKTAMDTAALFANKTKIALAANVLLRAKTHGWLTPRRRLRLESGAYGPWHDGKRGPCGLQLWLYGREIRSCGLALSGVDEK